MTEKVGLVSAKSTEPALFLIWKHPHIPPSQMMKTAYCDSEEGAMLPKFVA